MILPQSYSGFWPLNISFWVFENAAIWKITPFRDETLVLKSGNRSKIIGNCQRTCLPRGLLLFVYPVGLSELKLNSVNQKWSKKDRKVCFMTENDRKWPQLIKMTTSYRQRKKFYFTKYKLVSNAQIMEMPMVC